MIRLNRSKPSMDFFEPAAHYAMHLYYKIHYSGTGNIPKQGPALIVPKHLSYLDIILEGMLLRRECSRYGNWIMKDNIPLPQNLLYDLGGIIIRRPGDAREIKDKDERRKFLEKAKEVNKKAMAYVGQLFQKGELVVAHPEGTRTKGMVGPLRKELFEFVLETERRYEIDIPIIPIGIEYGRLWVPFSGINVKVGEPIDANTPNLVEIVRTEIEILSNLG